MTCLNSRASGPFQKLRLWTISKDEIMDHFKRWLYGLFEKLSSWTISKSEPNKQTIIASNFDGIFGGESSGVHLLFVSWVDICASRNFRRKELLLEAGSRTWQHCRLSLWKGDWLLYMRNMIGKDKKYDWCRWEILLIRNEILLIRMINMIESDKKYDRYRC